MTDQTTATSAGAGSMLGISGTELEGFEVRAIQAAVVYGAKSRAVLHIHHAITFGADEPPADPDLAARALQLARSEFARRKIDVGEGLQALVVDADALQAGVEYRVDAAGRALVAVSPPRAAAKP